MCERHESKNSSSTIPRKRHLSLDVDSTFLLTVLGFEIDVGERFGGQASLRLRLHGDLKSDAKVKFIRNFPDSDQTVMYKAAHLKKHWQ